MSQQTVPVAAAWPGYGDPARRPRILACDPSLSAAGYAWTDHTGQIGVATVHTSPQVDSHNDRHRRIDEQLAYLTGLIRRIRPQAAAIELLPKIPGQDQTHILAGLHWFVRHTLHQHGIPYVLIQPAHLKMYATGRGDAAKKLVLVEMQRLVYPVRLVDDNQGDAVAALAMALDAYKAPLAVMLGRSALSKVDWPVLESPVPPDATRAPSGGAGEASIPSTTDQIGQT